MLLEDSAVQGQEGIARIISFDSYVLGDNSSCFQKFVTEELDLSSNVCQTHATTIAKNNGTHSTYFDSTDNYEVFCNLVCSMM